MKQLVAGIVPTMVVAALVAGIPKTGAAQMTTGVDVVGPGGTPAAELSTVAQQLRAAGVRIVRTGLPLNPKDLNWAKELYANGTRIILDLSPKYPQGTQIRQADPDFPGMRPGQPLIEASVELSRAFFRNYLNTLDANGIVLAGLELDNEINWTDGNKSFPLPGQGRVFSLADLHNASDPETRRIAQSYLVYLKVLAALKEVRDQSKLNRQTPIISAGLSVLSPEGRMVQTRDVMTRVDSVSVSATIRFMRENGLDQLVDGYGIHFYPHFDPPDAIRRKLDNLAVSECKRAGSGAGKPCWVTEWGVPNRDEACPSDESKRLPVVRETMEDFRALAREGRIVNTIYYSWGTTGGDKFDRFGVFRCGELTQSGVLALRP